MLVHQHFGKPMYANKGNGDNNQLVYYTPDIDLYVIVCMKSNNETLLKSLLVQIEYRFVNCSLWLIFLFKFQLLGKSTSTHKKNGTTKHEVNDTNTFLAKLLSLFRFKSKLLPPFKVENGRKGIN